MSNRASRESRLASRPNGIPTAASFALARTELKSLQYQEVLKGIDKAVGALIGLFQGQNVGKMVVELV